MTIDFKNNKLRKACSDEAELRKNFGDLANRVKMRLNELRAVPSLSEISPRPPPRCHQLAGKGKGRFAVVVSGNQRIVFEPIGAFSKDADGGIDLKTVTTIKILEVVDYHGKK